jgi:hypothetical protein
MATLALVLTACSSNGDAPQTSNTTLTQAAPAPATSSATAASCTAATTALRHELTTRLKPTAQLSQIKAVATVRTSKDSTGWPSYFIAAQIGGSPQSSPALWAIAGPGNPAHVLALNALAEQYTVPQPGASAALRTRLLAAPEAAAAAACS